MKSRARLLRAALAKNSMGHKSTDLRYSHLSPEHRRAAIERLVTRRTATDYAAAASAG